MDSLYNLWNRRHLFVSIRHIFFNIRSGIKNKGNHGNLVKNKIVRKWWKIYALVMISFACVCCVVGVYLSYWLLLGSTTITFISAIFYRLLQIMREQLRRKVPSRGFLSNCHLWFLSKGMFFNQYDLPIKKYSSDNACYQQYFSPMFAIDMIILPICLHICHSKSAAALDESNLFSHIRSDMSFLNSFFCTDNVKR